MTTPHISDIRETVIQHFFQSAEDARELIGRFAAIQIDPVAIVAPNQLLVFGARGQALPLASLSACYETNEVLEVYAKERSLILRQDGPLIWPLLCERRKKKEGHLLRHKHELDRLRALFWERGVLSARDIQSERLSDPGLWGPKRSGTMLLNLLWEIGEILVASRSGLDIKYALANNDIWHSDDHSHVNDRNLRVARWARYLEGVAIMDSRDTFAGFERCGVAERRKMMNELVEAGTAVPVSGIGDSKSFCIVAKPMLADCTAGETTIPCFIPPLDNFIWNRPLVKDLWGMDYRWEIYTPPNQRRFGPYAMPLVTEDGLKGPVDFKFDRTSGVLEGYLSRSPLARSSDEDRAAVKAAADKLAAAIGAATVTLK